MAELKTKDNLIEEMFSAGAHYGYSRSKRHPSVQSFIYGLKNNVEIFDLEKTQKSLEKALAFVGSLASESKEILLASSKKETESILKKGAEEAGLLYVAGRWIGGTLTNFSEIRKRIQRYLDLKEDKEKGDLSKYTKKERLLLDKEMDDLKSKFGGILNMKKLPSALFLIDPKQEKTALNEAKRMKIPVIALSSSDCNISDIDYPVPGNDSSRSSIDFFVSKIIGAYNEGKSKVQK